jgi:hypothetical protein
MLDLSTGMIWQREYMGRLIILCLGLWVIQGVSVGAQAAPVAVCPDGGIQPRPADFEPGGIILTTFDQEALWVYDVNADRRYPLPETVPCSRNCHISPDHRWIIRMGTDFNFYKMRLDGTQRTVLTGGAADVRWWDVNTLLVWTPDLRAYLLPDGASNTPDQRTYLQADGVVVIQPGGTHALTVQAGPDNSFGRALEDLTLRELVGVAGVAPVDLGADIPYFNNAAWSPDGAWLAFVQQAPTTNGVPSSELYSIRPGDSTPTRWTDLTAHYGPVRINGHAIGDLSWSPDATRVAFWVMPMTGPNIAEASAAQLHIYDTAAGELRSYCGYDTIEHTPTPPRLIWSPDGTHIAFGGNVPNDNKGYLLLALRVSDGVFTELSDGIYPALGTADVIAWGQR